MQVRKKKKAVGPAQNGPFSLPPYPQGGETLANFQIAFSDVPLSSYAFFVQLSLFKGAKHGLCRINLQAKRLNRNNNRESCQNFGAQKGGVHMNYAARRNSGSSRVQNMAPVAQI